MATLVPESFYHKRAVKLALFKLSLSHTSMTLCIMSSLLKGLPKNSVKKWLNFTTVGFLGNEKVEKMLKRLKEFWPWGNYTIVKFVYREFCPLGPLSSRYFVHLWCCPSGNFSSECAHGKFCLLWILVNELLTVGNFAPTPTFWKGNFFPMPKLSMGNIPDEQIPCRAIPTEQNPGGQIFARQNSHWAIFRKAKFPLDTIPSTFETHL